MSGSLAVQRLVCVLLAGAAASGIAAAQPPLIANSPADDLGAWTLVPVPREMVRGLEEADALLAEEKYPDAIALLQPVLESPEDYLTGPGRDRKTSSIKQQVLQRLLALPRAGRQAYELQYGAAAGELWKQYEATADPALAEELTRRYPATEAAERAMARLAALRFDERAPLSAARWWDQLAQSSPPADHALERLAAWWIASGGTRPKDWSQELAAVQNPAGRWSGEPIPTEAAAGRVQGLSEHWSATRTRPVGDWLTVRGHAARNAVAEPAGPIGGLAWTHGTLEAAAGSWSVLGGDDVPLPALVDRIEEALRLDDRLSLPAFQPLMTDELVIARTATHLIAVDRNTGALAWRSATAYVPAQSGRDPGANREADAAEAQRLRWLDDLRQRLFRDQTAGTLSSDGRYVYAVEPSPTIIDRDALRGLPTPPVHANKLTALELRTGRMVWELGGRRTDGNDPFAGYFFLGPPLVAGDRLYCLAEVSGEQRLLQLRRDSASPAVALEWSQVLSAAQRPLGWSPLRLLSGLSPSIAGDVLVCPTTAGLVVGVDPVRRQLLWGYRYATHDVPAVEPHVFAFGNLPRPNEARPVIDEEEGYWLDSTPVIVGTRLVITPRDSMELHCLDLLSGELLWKRRRGDDLYVAGVDREQVVVVGRNSVSAWRLADGQPAWPSPLTVPAPSGRGGLLAGRYLLPTTTGDVLSIDLSSGRLLAQSKLPDGRVPGNLVAAHGVLVSQNVRELCAYRPLGAIEQQVAASLARSADDADALALRGEIRIFQGDEAGGVADLRRSLAIQPGRHASRVLAGVLIEGLKRDFDHYQSLIEEIDRVAVDPHLRAEFLQLVADGLERQGSRAAAFAQYIKLTGIPEFERTLERVSGVHAVRGDRIIRGRALSTYEAASPAERTQIDQLLQQHLERPASAGESPDRDLRFLRFFEGHPLSSLVRQRVIERLPAERSSERLHELRRLADSPTPVQAAFAAAQLTRWHLDHQEFAEARPWGQRLADQYAAMPIGDLGNAGSLIQRWSQEFGGRWSLSTPAWPQGDIEPQREPRQNAALRRVARMELIGPPGHVYRDWSFELHDDLELSIVARDAAGRTQWTVALPEESVAELPRGGPPMAAPRLYCAGTTLAVSLGSVFFVLDYPPGRATPQVLWRRSLVPQDGTVPFRGAFLPQTEILNSGRRRVFVGDRLHQQPFGQLLGLTHDQLCYHVGTRLMAVDPRTGQTLWMRQDAPRRIEGTLDDRVVTLFDIDRQQAIAYRAADGAELARRLLPNPHDWVWFHGDRVLTLRIRRSALLAELHEISSGRTLWQQELSASARCTVIGHQELLCLDARGRMTALELATGNTLWELPTPPLERLEFLWAARSEGKYRVVAGRIAPVTADNGQIRAFDGNQVPFTGLALQVDPGRNSLDWSVEIPPTAFEFTQPATAPLLCFAGRVIPPPDQANGVFPPAAQLSALFLDTRTGEVLYQTTETPAPGVFQWELEGEHRLLRANFLSWMIEFTVAAASTP